MNLVQFPLPKPRPFGLSAEDFERLNADAKRLAIRLAETLPLPEEGGLNRPYIMTQENYFELVQLVLLSRIEHTAVLERILDKLNGGN